MALAPMAVRPAPLSGLRSTFAATPGRIAGGLALVVLLLGLAVMVNLAAAAAARRAIQTIGSDAEPSVVTALQIGATLSSLDATTADDALDGGLSAAGTSLRWREGKAALDALLVQASRNITYPAETEAIQGLLRWTGEYHAALAEARAAADPTRPFIGIQRLQWSHRLLNEFAIPDSGKLADANRKPLEDDYAAYQASSGALFGCVAILLVVAALVWQQVFLMKRTRRLINLPLAAATVLALALTLGVALATVRERESVRIAKEDCYDSLDPLFTAKGVAAALDADLALWLLDPATRNVATDTFNARALTMLNTGQPNGAASFPWRDRPAALQLTQALTAAQMLETQSRPQAAKDASPKLGGLLGTELGNITFGPAERDPASEAVRALLDYLAVADQARTLAEKKASIEGERDTNLRAAMTLRDTAGAKALARLDNSLIATINVNQREFDIAVANAQRLIGWTPAVAWAGLGLIGLLTAAGLWQRYREYA